MNIRATCIAAALLIASAGAALGAVSGEDTINGKPLNDVHDIIREMNGGDVLVPKVSVMKIQANSGGMTGSLITAPFDPDRKQPHSVSKDVISLPGISDSDHYMGVTAAASTKPIDGAKRRVVVGDLSYEGGGGFKTFLTQPTESGISTEIVGSIRKLPLKFTGVFSWWERDMVITDLRGGLFIDGERDESFVTGILNDYRGDSFVTPKAGGDNGGDQAHVGVMILDGRKLNDESFFGDPTGGVMIDHLDSDSQFPVARIVAGDFDGDGIASEIAWIATPKEEPYNLRVYKVHRNASGAIETTLMKSSAHGSINVGLIYGSQRDTEAGCDIVAGDFDGDGKTEFAFVALNADGHELKPIVQVFKYVDGEFKSSWKNFSTGFPDFRGTHVPGVLAVAGDFDGNGLDEIAFVMAEYDDDYRTYYTNIHVATVAFDAVAHEAPTPAIKQHKILGDRILDSLYTPLARYISIASGPVYGAAGDGGFFDELYMTILNQDNSLVLYRLPDPLAKIERQLLNTRDSAKKTAFALVAMDLAGESLALGEPAHIITEDTRSYATILPAVPYHIDYIRSDWRDPKATPAPRALQLVTPPTSAVKYSKADTESDKTDTSFETRSHLDWNIGGGFDIKFPVKMVGFSISASGGYKSAADSISKDLSSKVTSKITKVDATVQDNDFTNYYTGTLHVWRYPIIGAYATDPKLMGKMFSDENGDGDVPKNDPLKNAPIDPKEQKYYTVVRLAEVTNVFSGATAGDRYQPDHDESNLFSYPNALQYIKAYNTKQKALSDTDRFSANVTATRTIAFDALKSETDAKVDTSGSGGSLTLSGGIAIPPGKKSIFAAKVEGGFSMNTAVSNGTTFTSTTKASTSYTVAVTADRNAADSLFDVLHTAYIDVGGITTLAFAVDMRPGIDPASAWADTGPYGTSPDPSLILPDRVSVGSARLESGTIVPVAKTETRPLAATRLRGVRLFDRTVGEDPEVGTSYTVSTLVRGRKYTIVVPVYNASFVDTGDFEVQLGWTTSDHLKEVMNGGKSVPAASDANITPIAAKTMSLRGWANKSDAHRGVVSFDWSVPADMPKDNYELCVRIVGRDGDIHRDWNIVEDSSAYDPCGNDWGHFSFAVIDELDLDETDIINYVTKQDAGLRTAASASEPRVDLTFKVDEQEPMTFDEFRRWLVGRTDPIDVEIDFAYTGDKVVREANVMIYELLEDSRARVMLDRDLTSIFPGKSVSRHVTIDPQRFLSRDLRVKISGSNISQTHGEPAAGGSSSGCGVGAAASAAIALLVAVRKRKK